MEYLIKNGRIIDTAQQIDTIGNLYVAEGKVVEITNNEPSARHVIDAEGCLVIPGLVDFHTHIYAGGSAFGIKPDFLLASGVTSAVDAGTSGTAGFEAFYSMTQSAAVTTKAFLSLGATGLCDPMHKQNYAKERVNRVKIRELMDRYSDYILGIKVSMSAEDVGELGMEPVHTAVEIASEYKGKRVCIHSTNMPGKMEDLLKMLRPGDIVCHCYHGTGSTILDEDGKVKEDVWEAKERGILFDLANGMNHFNHAVAQAAISQGFYPDIVSSDMVSFGYGLSDRNRSLPYVMSKLLSMGMPQDRIIQAVTEIPAALMNETGRIGSFEPGADADIAIFSSVEMPVLFEDAAQNVYRGDTLLCPQMTIKRGQVVFFQNTFNLKKGEEK